MAQSLNSSQIIDWYNEINSIRNKSNIELGSISVPNYTNLKSTANQINQLISEITNLYSNEYLNYANQDTDLNEVIANNLIKSQTISEIDARLLFLSKICANYINNNTTTSSSLPTFATTTYKVTNPPFYSTQKKSDTTNSTTTCKTNKTTSNITTENSTKQNCKVCNTNSTTSCKTFGQNQTDGTYKTCGQGCKIFNTNTFQTSENNFFTNSSPGNLTTTDTTKRDTTNKTSNYECKTFANNVTQSMGYQVKGED